MPGNFDNSRHSALRRRPDLSDAGPVSYRDGSPVVEAMAAPPVDTAYVLGRWHEHRVSWRGVWVEAKVLGKSLVTPPNTDVRKFLIVGRARSGTTLLRSMLDAHPDVTCEGEVLHKVVLDPVGHLERLARKSRGRAWGAKLLSYQMVQVQRFREPARLMAGLAERGYVLIHLVRGTFDQTLSLAIAQREKRYHDRTGNARRAGKVVLDPEDFVRRLRWNELLLRYEEHCLSEVPHLRVVYERDLLDGASQARTAGRLFRTIGVAPVPVTSPLRKVLPPSAEEVLENHAEIVEAVRAGGLGHLLPPRQDALSSRG